MIFSKLFGQHRTTPENLYKFIVAQSRQTFLYTDYGIKDDLNGRFDMVCLHMVLVLTCLTHKGHKDVRFNQHLIDWFFADMDKNLREMGVGDLSVGKKVRKMSEVFYGLGAVLYPLLCDQEGYDEALADALDRNFYDAQNQELAMRLAQYTRTQFSQLRKCEIKAIQHANIVWSAC